MPTFNDMWYRKQPRWRWLFYCGDWIRDVRANGKYVSRIAAACWKRNADTCSTPFVTLLLLRLRFACTHNLGLHNILFLSKMWRMISINCEYIDCGLERAWWLLAGLLRDHVQHREQNATNECLFIRTLNSIDHGFVVYMKLRHFCNNCHRTFYGVEVTLNSQKF